MGRRGENLRGDSSWERFVGSEFNVFFSLWFDRMEWMKGNNRRYFDCRERFICFEFGNCSFCSFCSLLSRLTQVYIYINSDRVNFNGCRVPPIPGYLGYRDTWDTMLTLNFTWSPSPLTSLTSTKTYRYVLAAFYNGILWNTAG